MAQTEEIWSVGRLLAWTTDYLRSRGAESPRLDAEVLLSHALGCPRIQLYTSFDEQPPEAARQKFRELVRHRAQGTPVAYLVGRREFYSLSFRVTPDVLIPRPETEFLLIRLLDLVKQDRAKLPAAGSNGKLRIADVGTGSGILAVGAAKNVPPSTVTAVDISPAALAVARENAAEHGVADKIEFVESDLFAALPQQQPFDFIVSNPPYVKTSEIEHLMADVRKFEPRVALEGGALGTEVIARLVPQAAERLGPAGWLLMEIGPAIEADVRRLVEETGRFELLPTIKDLAGHARVIQARRC